MRRSVFYILSVSLLMLALAAPLVYGAGPDNIAPTTEPATLTPRDGTIIPIPTAPTIVPTAPPVTLETSYLPLIANNPCAVAVCFYPASVEK